MTFEKIHIPHFLERLRNTKGWPLARANAMSITRQQAEILSKQLFPRANYLIRLRKRAQSILPVNDPLMQSIAKAQEAIQELCTKVHYLSCASGVGRPPAADGEHASVAAGGSV